MDNDKFKALLTLIIPNVIGLITKEYKIDEIEATKMFYNSRVYEVLEKEETKLWHLSPLMLFTLFDEETKTGDITFPEEA